MSCVVGNIMHKNSKSYRDVEKLLLKKYAATL
jgi:hypothetical protein